MSQTNPIQVPDAKSIPGEQFAPDPEQPRKIFDQASLVELGQNMLTHGQLVPLIVFWCMVLKKFVLLDGERRWRSGTLVGIKQFLAIVLAQRPSRVDLRILQLSLDVHHVSLSPMELSDAYAAIMQEKGLGVTELAALLNKKQPTITRSLTLQKGCPEVKDALRSGSLDSYKGYHICREPDFEKQRDLLKVAPNCDREELQRRGKRRPEAQVKVSKASFAMPGGIFITFSGKELTLDLVVQVAGEFQRIAKKAHGQGIDIRTQQKVMAETAKPRT